MTNVRTMSVAERFDAIVAGSGDREALIARDARFTYSDLDRWSDAIAADLQAGGAPTDRPVAIITASHLNLAAAVLGAIKAGRFSVAVDAKQPRDRVEDILTLAGATHCVLDADAPAPPGRVGIPVAERSHRATPFAAEPHELLQLVFTSGSTGRPKAIAMRQEGFVERVTREAAISGRAAGERVSYTALPGFARGTGEILGSLLNGATLCAFDARNEPLGALARMIREERVTVLSLTPALFRRFVATLPADADLSSLRKLRLGADVVTIADVHSFIECFPPTCTLERSFNATETGPVLHVTITHETALNGGVVPVGRPRGGVSVRLVDAEGRDVADGEPGEMIVTSHSVARGYWNDEALSRERFFVEDGSDQWSFRTGDLLQRDEQGLYYFIGRRDAQLKIHGRRIDPLDVENALVTHAGAREAAVVAFDMAGEARLAAFVVMRRGVPFLPRVIRMALRDRLPAWMIPARVIELDALPVNSAGKVDRLALGGQAAQAEDGGVGEPAQGLEGDLAAIWSRALGRPVSVGDDFFDDHGGESIVAAQIITEVNRLTGRSLPLSALLELRTVARMAAYIRAEPVTDHIAIAIRADGTLPPLFFAAGAGGSVLRFRNLALLLDENQPFYGLTHHGFTLENFPKSLEDLAAFYVSAVRRIQPSGPYYLGGYSLGGRVAFTMARQLADAGEHVAFVGMLDTRAEQQRASVFRRVSKYRKTLARRPVTNAVRYTRAVGRRVLRVFRWLSGKGWTFATFAPAEIDALNAGLRRFEVEPTGRFAGRATLFIAEEGWGSMGASEDLGWSRLCRDGVEVVPVAGDHHTIIRDDVGVLAAAMSRELERARRAIGESAPRNSTDTRPLER